MEPSSSKVTTTVTLAPALRDRLDAAAAAQDRSRSWVTAQAIREYLDRCATPGGLTLALPGALIEAIGGTP